MSTHGEACYSGVQADSRGVILPAVCPDPGSHQYGPQARYINDQAWVRHQVSLAPPVPEVVVRRVRKALRRIADAA